MSGARKLQTEIDRVMKKVDEGVELFDDIYEKVYSAEQQSQKEKFEVELKKEIKKLQRLRDQIKSWISGSEVKDKDSLLEYRRLIETKMEAFKVVEKETKTKTFSKEGLARQEKLDPEEQKRNDTIKWISDIIDQLQTLIDEQDLEIERLSAGRGKKTNKNQIEECNQHLTSHRFHMSKLEGIMRLVRNERISAETVDEVKEDLEYYIESHEDDDYMMAYDEECFYEVLGLDDLDVVNVDRVTQASTSTKKKDDDATSASSGSKKEKKSKSSSSSGMIPLTIGRARSSAKDKGSSSNEATPTKIGRSTSSISSGPAPVTIPAPTKAPPAPAPGGATSMAAMLKRESEERQKAQA
jgi:CCR4-NOT transcription complex subunit 3